jgi:predicted transposase YbfD/YdcC
MRFCYVIDQLESIRDRDLWPELRSVVCVVSHREEGGMQSDKVCYYISSRRASTKEFPQVVRSHWSIENPCHCVLDVAFREDDHRLREGHAPANLSLVRKMALTMLKKADAKCGIKNRRLRAGGIKTSSNTFSAISSRIECVCPATAISLFKTVR